MPLLIDGLPTSAMGTISPLRSNLEDMIGSCRALNKHIAMMNEDKETFGLLTEETYCYDAPEVLTQLTKITRTAALCIRDLNLDDEAFETDEPQLALVLYNFISEHKRILNQLTALGTIMKSTGSLYGALGGALHRQEHVVSRFREVLDARYISTKTLSAPDWVEQVEAMRLCLEAYPAPVEEDYNMSGVPESV
ncbi:hypothetical protein, variant [Verruconis gallopava]|nr:hypothetical protein, variant [Verruconis gallopava]KIW07177.1 hypothetical protein, variant [Verruconis gallopava]